MCTAKVVMATVLATEVIGESPFIIIALEVVISSLIASVTVLTRPGTCCKGLGKGYVSRVLGVYSSHSPWILIVLSSDSESMMSLSAVSLPVVFNHRRQPTSSATGRWFKFVGQC